jgi:hypothetical protein
LSQQLSQLAQFQQTRVGIVCEVTLRKHTNPQELFVVLFEVREVAEQSSTGTHDVTGRIGVRPSDNECIDFLGPIAS